jgi:importin subunit alpha-1
VKTYAEMVEEAGGAEALEELQQHANTDVYEKAVELMETYFEDDDEDENLAPAVNATAKTFTFGAAPTSNGTNPFGASNPFAAANPFATAAFGGAATTTPMFSFPQFT